MSRLWIRLLAFNLLLVFLPVAGVLFLDTYEDRLLRAQERTMGQEGRLLAAAVEAHGTVDDGFPESILVQLGQRHLARLRVVDHNGRVVADSAALGPRRDADDDTPRPADETRGGWLYRIGSFPFRMYRSLAQPAADDLDRPVERGEPRSWPEVQDALAGRYGATTRITDGDRRRVTLYIAIPVRTDDAVIGAVLVSQSTARILSALQAVRLDVLKVFLASLAAAIVLSLVVATTIARPLTRLQRRAEAILDRRGRLKGVFVPTRRSDEIGDLERALAELTRRLEQHLAFTESFASDVAHEFRNPLAAIRTATEMALDVDDDAQRRRFLEMIGRDVARMERLVSEAREVSRIDARLDEEERVTVAVDELLSTLIESFRLRAGDHGPQFVLALADHRVEVSASPDRLTQAFENILANAVSFSPTGGMVTVTVRRAATAAVVTVADDGPGIPQEHRERIFDRFFSYRPGGGPEDGHSGLGLSVVRAIVEGYGGSVRAEARHGGGTKMVVELPLEHP